MSLRGHLVISGNIFGCYNLGDGAAGILWVEARDAAKLPAMPRSASHDKELSFPKELAPRLRNVTRLVFEGDVLRRNKSKKRIKILSLRPTQVLLPQTGPG